MQGQLTIERMCYLAQVNRAGFYRFLAEKTPAEEEVEVRAAIQKIAIEHRLRYGYRRITAELRRQGMQVNRKRVARIMREDNLLAIKPRAFMVTTDSRHRSAYRQVADECPGSARLPRKILFGYGGRLKRVFL